MDPILMFERAAAHAASVARSVAADQRALPTPCSEWDVQALLEHMAGGPQYLFDALGADQAVDATWPEARSIELCLDALRAPGALQRRCLSPAGFEWSITEAAAGTAMDQFVHTWDLRVALGENPVMDVELADAIVAMFLPQMPELGRQAGFVGPEIPIAADAPASERLLGAMGRNPVR